MRTADLLTDDFERLGPLVHGAVDGLGPDELAWQPDAGANSIAWLVWHLTRIQDDHVAGVSGRPQAWTEEGWVERFGLPFPSDAHGYGHGPEEVAALAGTTADLLAGYHDAVLRRTLAYVADLVDEDLDRIVDTNWDPPVTLGARLISVLGDDHQHVGQAAYLRGLVERR